jgi:peptidoglycan hydrolase CwlO-like protein
MTEEKTTYSRTTIIVGSILAAAVVGIIVLSILTYLNSTSDKEDIGTLYAKSVSLERQLSDAESELTSLSNQLADAKSRIDTLSSKESSDVASLQDGLSSATEQITSLSNQAGSVLSQISSLQADVSYDASNITSLQSQLSAINTQLASLGDTTASLQNTLTSLENTVNSLVTQVNSLKTQITSPVILFSSQAVSQAFGSQTLLYTYTPTYNGYFYIGGTSSSTTGYIRVTNNSTATYTDYAFGTGTSVTAAVTGGYNYSIIFGNSDASGTITATLSATYYPTPSSTTHVVNLFTSQAVSQAFGSQTLLYTYTPTYNGYFYIGGTSSSTTGYIRVTNNSTATYTDYAFGTGNTVTTGVTAGYSYSIRFGNSDASGTITALLSATYNY